MSWYDSRHENIGKGDNQESDVNKAPLLWCSLGHMCVLKETIANAMVSLYA